MVLDAPKIGSSTHGADMARLILIDEWKCLNRACGHRWDASVSYDQLREASGSVDVPCR